MSLLLPGCLAWVRKCYPHYTFGLWMSPLPAGRWLTFPGAWNTQATGGELALPFTVPILPLRQFCG